MQEAKKSTELLLQANYVDPTKQGSRPGQRGKPGGGGRGGGKPAKDADKGSRPRTAVVEEEVDARSAGCAATLWQKRARRHGGAASPAVVLLDSGCSHHLSTMKEAFVDLGPSGDVKHMRCFNGALKDVEGWGTIARERSGSRFSSLICSTSRVLCTNLRLCTATSTTTTAQTVALRTIATATNSSLARWHVRLAHVGVDTITSLAKHEVATGLDIQPSVGTDSPCISCVGGNLARHTFPDKFSDTDDALAIVHIDLCRPFWVAAKDGSLYFLLPKDHKTRYVWVRPVAKKSNVLREFEKWLMVAERRTKKSVLMLRSDLGGEFLGKQFTDFVDGKGNVNDFTCPYILHDSSTPASQVLAAGWLAVSRHVNSVSAKPTTCPRLHVILHVDLGIPHQDQLRHNNLCVCRASCRARRPDNWVGWATGSTPPGRRPPWSAFSQVNLHPLITARLGCRLRQVVGH
ncbi:unnamed protein product [Closterium sp. NIES-53]